MNHEQLIASLRATARELEMTGARADGVDHMNKVLSEANNSLAAQVASLKEVNGIIETDRAVVQQKLDGAVDIANSLKARVEELESYAKGTAVTIDQLRASKNNAVQGFSEQMERANKAQAAFEDTRDRLDDVIVGRDRAQASLDNHILILHQKCKRIEELEQWLEAIRQENVRLIAQRDHWQQKSEDMEENWRLTIAECDKIKQRIRPVELENYILKTNMQNAQNTVRDLQTATEAKELALAAQVAENSRLVGVCTRLRQKLSEYWVADLEDKRPLQTGSESSLAGCIKQTEGE